MKNNVASSAAFIGSNLQYIKNGKKNQNTQVFHISSFSFFFATYVQSQLPRALTPTSFNSQIPSPFLLPYLHTHNPHARLTETRSFTRLLTACSPFSQTLALKKQNKQTLVSVLECDDRWGAREKKAQRARDFVAYWYELRNRSKIFPLQ